MSNYDIPRLHLHIPHPPGVRFEMTAVILGGGLSEWLGHPPSLIPHNANRYFDLDCSRREIRKSNTIHFVFGMFSVLFRQAKDRRTEAQRPLREEDDNIPWLNKPLHYNFSP